MTTDIEITLSPGKKAWVTPHSGTFVVHEESRVHLGEPVKDEYSALWRGKIRVDREGGEKEALVKELWCGSNRWIHQPEREKVTDSLIPKIANKSVKRVFKKQKTEKILYFTSFFKIFCRICDIYCVTYILSFRNVYLAFTHAILQLLSRVV